MFPEQPGQRKRSTFVESGGESGIDAHYFTAGVAIIGAAIIEE
jgi:hypothetical protein